MGGPVQPRPALAVLLALSACLAPAAAQAPPDIDALITRVGARVADYYRRAQSLICVETSTVQPIQRNWSPAGMARTVESELRLEFGKADGDGLPEPRVVRTISRINGRAPRERDKTDRNGCTDPTAFSPEPLAFLLQPHREEYRFTSIREGKEHDRAALIVEFTSANRAGPPQLVKDEGGHDDCFDWSGTVPTKGRVWVDARTYDVLRLERHIAGPVDVRVPRDLQRRYGFGSWVVIDRDDLTLQYEPVVFSGPDQVVLLPSSMDSLLVLRGGLQSIRRTTRYSGHRRFLTNGRVIKGRWLPASR